jgi:hypothetical protein
VGWLTWGDRRALGDRVRVSPKSRTSSVQPSSSCTTQHVPLVFIRDGDGVEGDVDLIAV